MTDHKKVFLWTIGEHYNGIEKSSGIIYENGMISMISAGKHWSISETDLAEDGDPYILNETDLDDDEVVKYFESNLEMRIKFAEKELRILKSMLEGIQKNGVNAE